MLAAGFSRRMGKPKLELPLGDSSVLERSLAAAAEAPFFERVLVVREKLREFPSFRTIAIGEEAEKGMHRSVRAGIEALNPCEAVSICLADQPFITAADYDALFGAWRVAAGLSKSLLYPEHQGQRGNPAIVASTYFGEILKEPDSDRGCHYLFRRHPEKVYAWQTSARGFYQDLDDWETYQSCQN